MWGQLSIRDHSHAQPPRTSFARATAELVHACFNDVDPQPELHLVGHSAGSIFLGHLIPFLAEQGLPVKTLTLFAPACTTELFKQKILKHLSNNTRLTIFNMTDQTEQDDRVGPVYHKSLLYLVSEAFETKRKTLLLGMEVFLIKNKAIRKALGKRVFENDKAVIYSVGGPSTIKLASQSTTHGGFDNDEDTLNSTLRIIRGKNKLSRAFVK